MKLHILCREKIPNPEKKAFLAVVMMNLDKLQKLTRETIVNDPAILKGETEAANSFLEARETIFSHVCGMQVRERKQRLNTYIRACHLRGFEGEEMLGLKTKTIEDIGYVVLDFFRGEDLEGYWHEEDYFCYLETADQTIDLGRLIGETFDEWVPACAIRTCGSKCNEEDLESCPHINKEGLCKPKILKFKITMTVEAQPVTDSQEIEQWWRTKNPPIL